MGHVKWVHIMTDKELPDELIDCKNCKMTQTIEGEIAFKHV